MDKVAAAILPVDASLVGQSLENVYHYVRTTNELPKSAARFKKKEDMAKMAKSILKHRIQTLTGKSLGIIESEMKFRSPDGTGLPLQKLRILAHFLIMEAAGLLELLDHQASGCKRKRQNEEEDGNVLPAKKAYRHDDEEEVEEPKSKGGKKASRRAGREGLPPQQEEGDTKKKVEEEIETLGLGPNPTPQMIARKRRSLAISSLTADGGSPIPKTSKRRATMVVPAAKEPVKVPVQPKPKKVVPPRVGYPGAEDNEIFLVEGDVYAITHDNLAKHVNGFSGANLIVLHTPVEWQPQEVHSFAMAMNRLNNKAKTETFSLLVGCGINNVHMFREALLRHTNYVQFVVFEREDQNLDKTQSILRDVNSFFLLAYFFPKCLGSLASPPPRMVRPGATTCFRTKSIEDLENTIVHSLSEKGDWVLDVACGDRELSLAAQKAGRNAVALHFDGRHLESLREKASAISCFHDKSFRLGVDGLILTL